MKRFVCVGLVIGGSADAAAATVGSRSKQTTWISDNTDHPRRPARLVD